MFYMIWIFLPEGMDGSWKMLCHNHTEVFCFQLLCYIFPLDNLVGLEFHS